ncbi:MAG TPA: ABC transporter ATP-binding protein, partial [Myxococcota bacterium]|nr:ABC transporter ATP-binding protein [Myxococcota bacterium]
RGDQRHVTITALDGVSLSLFEGDRVAIVGHNGAGKTTLLRVLAGIYEPSRGRVVTRGTVAPLFDLALGMDPDATGLENIRLRGLLLGMNPREIARHEAEIVAFSELGDYIHMPIRAYSAGMRLRLAFAISTAREPEILLLDEMIGVGDARFFERAQERLNRYLTRAGIVVLASHQTKVLHQICNKALLLHHGKLIGLGSIDEVLESYASLTRG